MTVDDYQEQGYDSDSDFQYDDKSYKTSDDSTVKGDNDLDDKYDLNDDPDQQEEDQQ